MANYRKLSRPSSHRNLMLRNLTLSLLKSGKITTTETRAKETRKFADRIITLAKKGDLHSRRQVVSFLGDKEIAKVLFDETAAKYADRQGGYTRILKLGPRRGDAAPMAILELI